MIAHLVVYLAVNGFLVLLWLATGGEPALLADPLEALRAPGFWPKWPAMGWGIGLAVHLGVGSARRTRRGRRRRARPPATPDAASAGSRDERPGTRWIAAMFTDLVDSSALASTMGDEAWAELIGAYRSSVRRVIAARAGAEVGTQGDGFLLRFDSPGEALRAAIELQRTFSDDRDAGIEHPPVRIGVHAGQAVAADGDVLGQMVNLAARVADAAEPDEILVTEAVADHAPPDVKFDDRGLVYLRGAPAPRHLLAVRWV